MENKKQELIQLILEVNNEAIIDYLILFTQDFIERHSVEQITEQ